jgi:hypothetical protein
MMRDILMTVKGTPKEVVFITLGTDVEPGAELHFIVDETLASAISTPNTLVFFKWNDSAWEWLPNSQTIVKTASPSGTDTFTLDIAQYSGDKSVADVTYEELAPHFGGRDITGKTGTIIVEE